MSVILPLLRSIQWIKMPAFASAVGNCTSKCNSYSSNVSNGSATFRNSYSYQSSTGNETVTKLITSMNFASIKDAEPFYKLPVITLCHIYKTTKDDESKGYCKNRLYYISERIKFPPSVVSEKISKRTFIYTLSFDWLESSLNVLLEMGISGDRILRDLWVLKYHHLTIRERLQRVKGMGIDVLYPWMVRCSEDILERFVTIAQDTKNILGDYTSTHVYLANRLNTTPENIEDMCRRIPAMRTIRVTKDSNWFISRRFRMRRLFLTSGIYCWAIKLLLLKSYHFDKVKIFLDFLIKEGFSVEDILKKPRVLTASQITVQQRLDKLRKLGLCNINLNVLSRSRRDFKKYVDSLESMIIQIPRRTLPLVNRL